jgi:hypothetical protein
MKYLLSIGILLLLSGCASKPVPVKQVWPQVPSVLMEKCPPLKQIQNEKAGLKDLLMTVIENYAVYYKCSDRVQSWQDWHNQQQKIFEDINK